MGDAVNLAKGQDLCLDVGISEMGGAPYPDYAPVRVYVDGLLQAVVRTQNGRVRWRFRAVRSGPHEFKLEVNTVEGPKWLELKSTDEPLGRFEVVEAGGDS